MNSFTELHCHLLPGVDDGPRFLDESVQQLQMMKAEGVEDLVLTSHFETPRYNGQSGLYDRLKELEKSFAAVTQAAQEAGGTPRLHLGQEILSPTAADIERVLKVPGMGLAGTQYLLVEFGFKPLSIGPEQVIEQVRSSGREIVVAHPERYFFQPGVRALDCFRLWSEMGAHLQVNLGSLLGEYNRYKESVQEEAWAILEEGLAALLASDHHGVFRPQILHQEIYQLLEAKGGREVARTLLIENPRRVLRGDSISNAPPLPGAGATY